MLPSHAPGVVPTKVGGIRVEADGHVQRIQQLVLGVCIDRLGGRVEIPLEMIVGREPDSDVVIEAGLSETGEKIVVVRLRRR